MQLPPGAPGADKLTQVVANLDGLLPGSGSDGAAAASEARAAFAGVDAVFCALGTTRAVSDGRGPQPAGATQERPLRLK